MLARRAPIDVDVSPPRGWGAIVGVGRSGGCGCASDSFVASVLGELGMGHAAAMHADHGRDWTPDDWRAHIDEEHRVLFPFLLEVGVDDLAVAERVARLEADHAVYLARLSDGQDLPHGSEPYSVDAHAAIEDELVTTYAEQLRARAAGAGVDAAVSGAPFMTLAPSMVPTPAKHAPSSSWWPWVVGGALGVGAWATGFGPLGIVLGTVGGMGGTALVQKTVTTTAKTAPPVAAADPIVLAYPTAFVDPATYFAMIAKETKALSDLKDARWAESDQRAQDWKDAIKQIPIYGALAAGVFGFFYDVGAWGDKIVSGLGYGYAEQNAPEDVKHASDEIVIWLGLGFIPPPIRWTAKDGANNYGNQRQRNLLDVDLLPPIKSQALYTMGRITIANSGDPVMKAAILYAGKTTGSLPDHGGSLGGGVPSGTASIIAACAATQFRRPYAECLATAVDLLNRTKPYGYGYLESIADVFIWTMATASDRALEKKSS